jgi:hypothetical protein
MHQHPISTPGPPTRYKWLFPAKARGTNHIGLRQKKMDEKVFLRQDYPRLIASTKDRRKGFFWTRLPMPTIPSIPGHLRETHAQRPPIQRALPRSRQVDSPRPRNGENAIAAHGRFASQQRLLTLYSGWVFSSRTTLRLLIVETLCSK